MASSGDVGAGGSNPPKTKDEKRVEMLRKKLEKAKIKREVKERFPVLYNHMLWEGVLFSWITADSIELPSLVQHGDTCWAIALYRAQNYAVYINGLKNVPNVVGYEQLVAGVPQRYLNETGGIDTMELARDFLVANNYAKNIVVHRRNEDDYQGFETLIEALLRKGPVAVAYDVFPSDRHYDGTGVYVPTVSERQSALFEKHNQHDVVITGYGAQIDNGRMIKFWETQDSKGSDWGLGGFGRLARGVGLIKEVVEFQF